LSASITCSPVLRALSPVLQVVQHAQAGVDLPNVVGVQALHGGGGRGAQQLLGVQPVVAQGARHRAGRQRRHLAGGGVDALGAHLADVAQLSQSLLDAAQLLVALAKTIHQPGADHLCLSQRQGHLALVAARLARRPHRDLLEVPVHGGTRFADAHGQLAHTTALSAMRQRGRIGAHELLSLGRGDGRHGQNPSRMRSSRRTRS
jgi:hypothetical protein